MQNLQKIFSKLAKQKHKELNIIHNSDQLLYFSDQCVPDQLVGQVTFNGNQYIFKNCCLDINNKLNFCRETITNKKKKNHVIIMILESPHKHEFDKNTHTPIGPANGTTGRNIRKKINECICNFISNSKNTNLIDCFKMGEEFDLILMNAIQFQTSLGHSTKRRSSKKIVRDDVFKGMWKHGGKEDFLKRLKKYMNLYDQGGLILNLCTDIKINTNDNFKPFLHHNKFRLYLNYEISLIKKDKFTLGYGGHPASWIGKRRINIQQA